MSRRMRDTQPESAAVTNIMRHRKTLHLMTRLLGTKRKKRLDVPAYAGYLANVSIRKHYKTFDGTNLSPSVRGSTFDVRV